MTTQTDYAEKTVQTKYGLVIVTFTGNDKDGYPTATVRLGESFIVNGIAYTGRTWAVRRPVFNTHDEKTVKWTYAYYGGSIYRLDRKAPTDKGKSLIHEAAYAAVTDVWTPEVGYAAQATQLRQLAERKHADAAHKREEAQTFENEAATLLQQAAGLEDLARLS